MKKILLNKLTHQIKRKDEGGEAIEGVAIRDGVMKKDVQELTANLCLNKNYFRGPRGKAEGFINPDSNDSIAKLLVN